MPEFGDALPDTAMTKALEVLIERITKQIQEKFNGS
jgi:hypothetical protein